MPSFRTPVDIANRALQHCGAKRIATADFSEVSVNCSEVSSCYDKLREAELEERYWTFAIRRTALEAIDSNTMLLSASLWESTTTYFVGSIVADENGNLWVSNIPSNLGNDPLLTTYWDPYFGPMAVPLFNASNSLGYYAGALVYTTPGDGTNKVFLSLIDGNTDDPLVKTVWLSTATYFMNQVVTFYPTWAVGTTYGVGAGVTYLGATYVSTSAGNLGNTPGAATQWMQLTLSTTNGIVAAEWNIGTSYGQNSLVDYNGTLYLAIAASTGLIPPNNAGSWAAVTGGVAYQSLVDLNFNNEPDTSPSQWTSSFTGGSGSVNWLEIGGSGFPNGVALTRLNIVYPAGSGPSTNTFTRNVYRLPANYLRRAPQNPKPDSNVFGGPSGVAFDDWLIEGDYLITWDPGPIMFRFVMSLTDVSKMRTMFCEGLALRIGLEVCERITQSEAKVQEIIAKYRKWETDARQVDGVETGFTDQPDDDWLTVRL